MGLSGQSGYSRVEQIKPSSILNPTLFHSLKNCLREQGARQGDEGFLAIKIWREHRNFSHSPPKARQEGAILREVSKVLEHLHQKEESVKSSRKPSRSSGHVQSPTRVTFS